MASWYVPAVTIPVAHRNVSYHEVVVHEIDGGLDSELWCTGNLYVCTQKRWKVENT